jgi:hypothetical protein
VKDTKNRVRQVTTTFSGEYVIFILSDRQRDSHIFSEASDIKTFLSIYYPLIILKIWHKPSTLIAQTMCQFISVVNIGYGHLFKYLSNVTNITSKSYVHPSICFKLIFQCSHKSFVIFMYAFEYLAYSPENVVVICLNRFLVFDPAPSIRITEIN